ncbi:heavy metal translocating P-type ATPase [Pukyongiella litopenaei]|uniref:P-type Zn(2+) transporter n=1 Tax=Pukyongiella litopenaei TaxID=2605946 RepID=A0A2S0MU39_9RHOB|nr:heavy metal translocating P-type ATPase [Pukyongiella litopenaei]AVO39395.1 cadmium-translocating P-type ATPase [Pukyongiella litopenaei]
MSQTAKHPANLTFRVEGMDCASCAATIKTALSGMTGVGDVEVSVARERMTLTASDDLAGQRTIENTLKTLGYTATRLPDAANDPGPRGPDHAERPRRRIAEPGQHTQMFRIDGMDCASCASTITSALAPLPGVANPDVSIAREILTMDLDQDRTPIDEIERIVGQLGFTATHVSDETPGARTPGAQDNPWWRKPRGLHLLASLALCAAGLALTRIAPAFEAHVFTAIALFAIFPIARRALAAARLGAVFTIQMLMTIAAIGAILIGEQLEALAVVVLFMIGELLEGLAAEKARSGIKALGRLLPRDARVDDDGTIRQIPADSLRIGQVVVARPGDRIAADGEIVDGISSVDESPVTGESVPVTKSAGDAVFAGTVNHDATLRIRVSRAPEDNTIARIIALVENAQDARAPTERFIERFSRIYMPVVLLIALAVVIVPPLTGLGTWETWIYRGLALLLIGCPCALVISVPAAIASSLSAGARHGILIKGGAVVENIARTGRVVFDKTGTLTEGRPVVTDIVAVDGDDAALLALATAIERESSHPLANAITAAAETRGIAAPAGDSVHIVPGKGMAGRVAGRAVFIGAPRFAADHAPLADDLSGRIGALEREGKTVAVVVADGAVAGLIALRDEPRQDARAGLADLKAAGVSALMMTGDNARTASAIAGDLGIEAVAEMLPEEKAGRVRELARAETVIMVGDGVNDAPALAEATVGVAIGSGTDVAMEAADAALMRNVIGDVARMIGLSRATMRNVRQNVVIALGLKAVFLVTTVTGLSGLWMAVLADTGATVLVTLNAMRLLGFLGRRGD